jgi:hypothetical protein
MPSNKIVKMAVASLGFWVVAKLLNMMAFALSSFSLMGAIAAFMMLFREWREKHASLPPGPPSYSIAGNLTDMKPPTGVPEYLH